MKGSPSKRTEWKIDVTGPQNILFAGASAHNNNNNKKKKKKKKKKNHSARIFFRLGQSRG